MMSKAALFRGFTGLLVVTCLCSIKVLALPAAEWVEISPLINGNILCAKGIQGTDEFYVGTEEGLYCTKNAGKKWQKMVLPAGTLEIKDMGVIDNNIIVADKRGIYIKKGETNWKRLAGVKNVTGITVVEEKADWSVLAWSGKKLFKITEASRKCISPVLLQDDISDVFCQDGFIFLATNRKVYILSDRSEAWKEINLPNKSGHEEETDEKFEYTDEENKEFPVIKDLNSFGNDKVSVATAGGIYILNKRGYLQKHLITTGFPSNSLRYVLYAGKYFFAATTKTVFLYSDEIENWQMVFKKTFPGNISVLQVHKNGKNCTTLWVGGEKYLYKQNIDLLSAYNEKCGIEKFSLSGEGRDTLIRDVQKMAIDYAEVNPEKIIGWRKGAKWKAVLPKLSIGFSESVGDNVEIYKSSTTSYVVAGPREVDNDWDINLTWDLSDLIWNDSQTSIDVRSKLMVQLREEILEEVTRLYFERKKLLLEVSRLKRDFIIKEQSCESNELSGKMMRIEELTAYLDALTGGKFSESAETDL